jgi:carboxymethylenebutenolidase
MGKMIQLKGSDGVAIGAFQADPAGAPRGGIVVIQEIFGVNKHIRAVADFYAAQGYLAIAPALFDRAEKNSDLGYGDSDRAHGFELLNKSSRGKALVDIAAAVDVARSAGRVGLVGFCWGGALVWFAAAEMPGIDAAVGYYGGGILGAKDLKPKVPVLLHFGENDDHIPAAGVRELAKDNPQIPIYLYPGAGHAFNRDVDPNAYHAPSADLARQRTLEFFARHVG